MPTYAHYVTACVCVYTYMRISVCACICVCICVYVRVHDLVWLCIKCNFIIYYKLCILALYSTLTLFPIIYYQYTFPFLTLSSLSSISPLSFLWCSRGAVLKAINTLPPGESRAIHERLGLGTYCTYVHVYMCICTH